MTNEELNIILSMGENTKSLLAFAGLDINLLSDEMIKALSELPLFPVAAKINDTDLFLYSLGSGWIEKGVMLLDKRTLSVIKLLLICIIPVKVAEMLILLSFGSRDKLREIYLKPLLKEGLVTLTIPDKPNSPEQRYVLTEKGRLFLGGFEII